MQTNKFCTRPWFACPLLTADVTTGNDLCLAACCRLHHECYVFGLTGGETGAAASLQHFSVNMLVCIVAACCLFWSNNYRSFSSDDVKLSAHLMTSYSLLLRISFQKLLIKKKLRLQHFFQYVKDFKPMKSWKMPWRCGEDVMKMLQRYVLMLEGSRLKDSLVKKIPVHRTQKPPPSLVLANAQTFEQKAGPSDRCAMPS